VFSIHLKTLIDGMMISDGYPYTVATWIVMMFPLSSMIDAIVDIGQLNRINALCSRVPAYVATKNIVELDGQPKSSLVEHMMDKVRECLENGKGGGKSLAY